MKTQLRYLASNLWTLPNTVLGLLGGLLLAWCLPSFDNERGYWKFCCGRGISSFVQGRGTRATTLGFMVIFWDPSGCTDVPLLEHELVHVRQYSVLGPFYLPIYLALVPFFGTRGRHPLEKPGYKRQGELRGR